MKSENEIRNAIETYSDMVRRVCFVYLKNKEDCEDIFQDVFVKYATCTKRFEDDGHLKAWILRVSINRCKDWLKRSARDDRPLEEYTGFALEENDGRRDVLEAVACLPQDYRTVTYLHYYEGYTAPEIGKVLRKNTNTIYTWLGRARDMLKEKLEDEAYAR